MILGGVVVWPYCFERLNEEARRRAERIFADHYRQFLVSVRSARVIEGEGIEVRGVSINQPGVAGPQAELLYIDDLFLSCSTNLVDMASNKLHVRQISIRKPTIRACRQRNNTWNVAGLLPLPQLGEIPPPVVVEDATVEIVDPQRKPMSALRVRNVNLMLDPIDPAQTQGKPRVAVRGYLAMDQIRRVDLEGWLDAQGRAWQLQGTVDGVELGPDLLAALPCECPQALLALQALRAQAAGRFRIDYDAVRVPAIDYELSGQLQRGRWDDARLPHPVTDLRATFRSNTREAVVDELTGRIGQSTVALKAYRQGNAVDSPLRIHLEARHLGLDPKWLALMPERWQNEWKKYDPTGEIDLDADAVYDGKTWQVEGLCRCLDVSICYYKFPYRVQKSVGTLELKHGLLKADLVTAADDGKVRIEAQWQTQLNPPQGWVEIHSEQLKFTDRLLAALPERTGEVVRQLHPAGRFALAMRVWRSIEGGAVQEHRQLRLNVLDGAIRYDKFPYPVIGITGLIEANDNVWTFSKLQGRKGAGTIHASGQLLTLPTGGDLSLSIHGEQVSLDDELRDALTVPARQLWLDLKPQGTVNLDAQLRLPPGQHPLQLTIRAEPASNNVSIEPARFPYRMDNIHGVLTVAGGRAEIANLRAEHGRTRLSAEALCSFRPDGGWQLRLQQMAIDRVVADRSLLQALPERLRRALDELHFTGAANVRGIFELAKSGEPGAPLTSNWDVELDMHQNNAMLGVPLENICGGAHLAGSFDGEKFQSLGDLHIDSALWRNLQVTEVRGPVWVDDTRLLVGFWADRLRQVKPERHLEATFYGGAGTIDGWLLFGQQAPYEFQLAVGRASLARWNQEALGNRERLSGEVFAQVNLRGKGRSLNDLGGRGSIQLRNANIYELPLMVSLLKVLNLRQPDSTAFTSSDIDFRIEGEHVYLDRFDLTGDAFSLLGQGEVNMNRQLRLTFHTMLADAARRPFLREVLGGASQQIMLIHAEGTLDQPLLRSEAFPGVNQALQQLQAELGSRPADATTPPK